LALDGRTGENDKIVETDGIKIVYEGYLDRYLDNVVIDYSSKWYNKGFQLRGAYVSSC